jgi:uncharacterized membrane protein
MGLLAVSLFGLVMVIDLIMGIKFQGLIAKTLNPFRVMETAEYIILLLFILIFLIKLIKGYFKKKRDGSPSST